MMSVGLLRVCKYLACILPPAVVKDSDALDLLKEFQQRSFHAFIFCAQDVDIQYILHMFCVIIWGSGQQPRNLDSGCWLPKFTRRALPSVGVHCAGPCAKFAIHKYQIHICKNEKYTAKQWKYQ